MGEARKFAAHGAHCATAGIDFIPVTLEALGGLSPLAINVVVRIGRLLGQCLSLPPKETTRHLFQQISVSLWRGNASLWCHRFPLLPPHRDGVIWTLDCLLYVCCIYVLFLFIYFLNLFYLFIYLFIVFFVFCTAGLFHSKKNIVRCARSKYFATCFPLRLRW